MKSTEGLRCNAQNRTMKGWVIYGAALNEGRGLFKSNNLFHDWLVSQQLAGTEDMERLAAMWAAGNPEEYRAKATSETPCLYDDLIQSH
jgi:hypothetical protein